MGGGKDLRRRARDTGASLCWNVSPDCVAARYEHLRRLHQVGDPHGTGLAAARCGFPRHHAGAAEPDGLSQAHQLLRPPLPRHAAGRRGSDRLKTLSETYTLEYGEATVELHADAFRPGTRILLMDDLIATGGSMLAAARLIQRCGGEVVETGGIIDLPDLGGSQRLLEAGLGVFTVCS